MHSTIVRASKPTTVTHVKRNSCCGVTACCTPVEQATDQSATVGEAKSSAGCACQKSSSPAAGAQITAAGDASPEAERPAPLKLQ